MIFRFADPYFLAFLILVPLAYLWYFVGRKMTGGTLRFSHLGVLKNVQKSRTFRKRDLLIVIRMLAFIGLILALARPQSGIREEEVLTQGVDIVLVMDISSSMLAVDIKPDRVEAAKQVAAEFVSSCRVERYFSLLIDCIVEQRQRVHRRNIEQSEWQ